MQALQNYCAMKNLFKLNIQNQTFLLLPVFLMLVAFTSMSFNGALPILKVETTCPSASFTVANDGCVAPCEMVFTNGSQNAASYLWDFGDGNTSAEMHPRHAYTSAGSFTVTLTASTDGCQEAVHIIIVETIDM